MMKRCMNKHNRYIALLCLWFFSSFPALALTFGANLITNPGAEKSVGAANSSEIVLVPGWIKNGNFTAVQYNASGGFPFLTDPGPKNRGNNFFAGGPNNSLSSASKIIDISSIAGKVDGTGVAFKVSGFFGGFSSQDDNAVLSVVFRNASKQTLNQVSIGSVLAVDRSSQTGLILRKLNGRIPKNSRSILVTLTMTRAAGSYNDGYADNLSLVLTEVAPLLGASLQNSEH